MIINVIHANIHCIIRNFITIVYSFIHLCSNKWWNGAIANNFLLNTFFQNICRKLLSNSNQNNANNTINGIKKLSLRLRRYTNAESNHHSANAQESPIKTFAGLILKRRNANNVPVMIPSSVVARYHQYMNVITDITHNKITIIHQANQSNQSVILIAFTIAIVRKKVITGYNSQIDICPSNSGHNCM